SNPRTLAGLQFSRLVPSTSLPTFRVKIAEKSAIFYSVLRFYKFRPLDLQFVEKFVEFTVFANGLQKTDLQIDRFDSRYFTTRYRVKSTACGANLPNFRLHCRNEGHILTA
ncbi:MAG TPA: hypothetical protein H9728_05520, partial [Candidatus Borkfalkia excrementavium]|nr:hypothetical protein [Candidatus Borkfalkia excrementavium]